MGPAQLDGFINTLWKQYIGGHLDGEPQLEEIRSVIPYLLH